MRVKGNQKDGERNGQRRIDLERGEIKKNADLLFKTLFDFHSK